MIQAAPIPTSGPSFFVTSAEVRATPPGLRAETRRKQTVRRPSPQQGIALEILGHAIEYLADTNFYHQRADVPEVKEALDLLKQSSRAVFAAAPEVLPAGARAVRWIRSHLPAQDAVPASPPVAPGRLVLVKR